MSDPLSINEERFRTFRDKLAKGFYIVDKTNVDILLFKGDDYDAAIAATKAWRTELWDAIKLLEREVCPMAAKRLEVAQRSKRK